MRKWLFVLALGISKTLWGYAAYFENFATPPLSCGVAGNWCLNFPVGRLGFMLVEHRGNTQTPYLDIQQATGSYYSIAPAFGGYLFLRGMANNYDIIYNNIWTGRMARYETLYNASATDPFGVQVIRYFAVIDPSDREDNAIYNRSNIGLWLVQNNAVTSETNFTASSPTGDWAPINNAIYFYEMQINRETQPIWGYFAGSDVNLNANLASAPRTNLTGTDNIGSTPNGLIFENDNSSPAHNGRIIVSRTGAGATMNSGSCPATMSEIKGYNYVRATSRFDDNIAASGGNGGTCGVGNQREVGMRLTHDGSIVRMYLNPNPHSRPGTHNGVNYSSFRNEWYRVGQHMIGFNTNMKVMLGQEQLFFLSALTEAVFDNFLIRPIAQSVQADIIQPDTDGEHRVLQSAPQRYAIKITPSMNATDAGIGEIYIRKPSGTGEIFAGANWNRNSLIVCLDPDSNASSGESCNGPGEIKLQYRSGSDHATLNSTLTNGEFQAYTLNDDFSLATGDSGNILAIRLKKQASPNNNHFTMTSPGAHIRVYFDLTATNTSYEGQNFTVWVHNEKFHDTAQEDVLDDGLANNSSIRYATTERMRATVANPNDLLVKAFSATPAANMAVSISPDPLYWGTYLPFATIELRTPSTGNHTDITYAVIQLPPEGDIDSFDFSLYSGGVITSYIDSLRIPESEEDGIGTDLMTFTTSTATIDDCLNNNHRFCYYSHPSNPNYRRIVVNYGTTYRIPGKNGYDRITFFLEQAPEFTVNTQIIANWSAWVDSKGFINGTTMQAVTAYQGNVANIQTIVRAQPPQTSAKISPTVLTNNVANNNPTSGTVTYIVKNNGGPSNHIRYLEILIPYVTYTCPAGDPHENDCNGSEPGTGTTRQNMATPVATDFTNLRINGATITPAPTVNVVGDTSLGGVNYRVVRISFDSTAKLMSGQTFTVDMNLKYYRNTNEPNQTFTIRHRADNENYTTPPPYPYPRYSDGGEDGTGTWTLTLTPPKPMGETFVFRGNHTNPTHQNNPPIIYTNEITTSDVVLNMKIYNRGGVGNNIHNVEIHVPSFYNVVDACSTYLQSLGVAEYCISHPGTNLVLTNTPFTRTIKIDYASLGQPLKSSYDTISATPCPTETNVPCEIVRITLQQDATLSDPSLGDQLFAVSDSDSDNVFETLTGPSADGDSTRRRGTFFAKLNNASGAISYTKELTGRSMTSRLEFPDPAAESFITTQFFLDTGLYEVDATQPSTTFKAFVKNTATLAGNEIYRLDIQFPTSPTIVTGTPAVLQIQRDHNGTLSTLVPGASNDYTVSWNSGSQVLTITYADTKRLPPSLNLGDGTSYVDIIEIQFTDTVTTTGNRPVSIVAYNKVGATITGKSVTAALYNGSDPDDNYNNSNNHDQNLFYKIPKAYGTATLMPKTVFTGSGQSIQSKFYLQNKAGSTTTNRIHKVEIKLPAGVTVANSSAVNARPGVTVNCLAGNGFTGGCQGPTESLELDYTTATPAFLDPQNDPDDEVFLSWTYTFTTEGTVAFEVRFDNNDGTGYAGNLESLPASLYTVHVYQSPTMKVEVISQPGDPTNPPSMVNNQTINSTVPASAYHRFQLTVTPATNPLSPKIHRLRITPPNYLDVASLDLSDALPAGTTMSQDGTYLYVNFPGGQLTAASTVLKFRLKDNRAFNVPGVNPHNDDQPWKVDVAYFHDLFNNSTYSHTNLPGPSFAGKLVPDGVVDEVVYVPDSAYNIARAIPAVSGSGAAGLAWNSTRMTNPSPKFVMYLRPKDVFRINLGDPPYQWVQKIIVVNQGEADNDLRYVEFKPHASLFNTPNSQMAGCTTSASCNLDTAPFIVKKGLTGAPESTYTTLTYGISNHYYLRSVESASATYTLSLNETVRLILSEAQRVKHNETLIIEFLAQHEKAATGSFLWSFKAGNYNHTVAAANNSDPVPLGESETTTVVTPSYTANFLIEQTNGVPGKRDITAQSTRNTFVFKLTNNSSGGDMITEAKIHFPGYFQVSSAVVSSTPAATVTTNSNTTAYDTSGIESSLPSAEFSSFNKNNYILLNFGSGIAPGQSATIQVTIDDTFFHHSPITMSSRELSGGGFIQRSGNTTEPNGLGGNDNGTCEPGEICAGRVTIKASAKYSTSGGAFQYITSFPSRSDSIEILQANIPSFAWVVSENLPMEGSTPRNHTVDVRIKNGAPNTTVGQGNVIYRAKIRIPRQGGINAINNLQWRKTGSPSWISLTGSCSGDTCSGNFTATTSTYYFAYLDFEPHGGLLPEETAEVRFVISENFSSNTFIDLGFRVDSERWVTAQGLFDNTSSSRIQNDTNFTQGDLAVTELAAQNQRVNFIPPDPPSEGFISLSVDRDIVTGVYNAAQKKFEFSQAQLSLLATYCHPSSPNLDTACDARFTLYTLGEYHDVYYEISNGSQNYPLEELKLRLSIFDINQPGNGWSNIQIAGITSARLGELSSPSCTYLDLYSSNNAIADDSPGTDTHNETCELSISYASLPDGGIPVGQKDTIRLRLRLLPSIHNYLQHPDAGTISYGLSGKQSGYDISRAIEIFFSAQSKRASLVDYKDVAVPANKQQYIYIRKAPFGRITGLLAPKDAPVNFQLVKADGSGATLYGGGQVPTVSAGHDAQTNYGRFTFDRVPAGESYAIRMVSAEPIYDVATFVRTRDDAQKADKSLFPVQQNQVTRVEDLLRPPYTQVPIEVSYRQLNAAIDNEVRAPLDTRTRIILPAGTLDNNPRINIRIEPVAAQAWDVLAHAPYQMELIAGKSVANVANHKVFNLLNELPKTGQLTPVVENQLKNEATLILGYDLADFPGVSENKLAVFYWDITRRRWVKLGGLVNSQEQTITVKITYMHRTYTILPDEQSQGISHVTVFPRVFTPGRADSAYKESQEQFGAERTYGNLKLTFELGTNTLGQKYEVGIYNLSGRLMRKWVKENTTGQGSIYWDGRDEYGGLVAGGIYIYVIQIGDQKYRGTLVVAR
ncbi:MAG: hypothetical protein RML34_07600 [Leptospiraceae bacterium]|nr:hypothetical protein [Leptospiraceae bacterium]